MLQQGHKRTAMLIIQQGVAVMEAACKFNLATVRARGMVTAFAIDSKNMADLMRQFPSEKSKFDTLMKLRRRELFTKRRRRRPVNSPDAELNQGTLARSISDPLVQRSREPHGLTLPRTHFAATDGQLQLNAKKQERLSQNLRATVEQLASVNLQLDEVCGLSCSSLDSIGSSIDAERVARWSRRHSSDKQRSGSVQSLGGLSLPHILEAPVPSSNQGHSTVAASATPSSRVRAGSVDSKGMAREKRGVHLKPIEVKLQRLKAVYGRPVWSEIFGMPSSVR